MVGLVVFLVQGPVWGKTLLAFSSIPIAILGNVLRVASLLAVASVWGADVGFKYRVQILESALRPTLAATVRLLPPINISTVPTTTSSPFWLAKPVRSCLPTPTLATLRT